MTRNSLNKCSMTAAMGPVSTMNANGAKDRSSDDEIIVEFDSVQQDGRQTEMVKQLRTLDSASHRFDTSNSDSAFESPYFKITSAPRTSEYQTSYMHASEPLFRADISKIFLASFFRVDLLNHVRFIDGCRVVNPRIHETVMQFREELIENKRPSEFTFLYMITPGYDPAFEHEIFSKGMKCGNAPIHFLGDPATGVYLSAHPDCTTLATLVPFVPYRVIMFKALLGRRRCCPVNLRSHQPRVTCDIENGSHIATKNAAANSLHDIYVQSLVYVFDKRSENEYYEYPRSIYPYAAVSFLIGATYHPFKAIRLPFLPKNKVSEYTLQFSSLLTTKVEAFSLYEHRKSIPELAIKGIQVQKMVKYLDVAKWQIIKDIFSGQYSNFSNVECIHLSNVATCIHFFVQHVSLGSMDESISKLIKTMQIEGWAGVFGVPYLFNFETDAEITQSIGLVFPNSPLSSLFGLPYLPADQLHCVVIKRVPVISSNHPLRTERREMMYLNMTKGGRIGRSDKISDNDIRQALYSTRTPQIFVGNNSVNGSSDNSEWNNRRQHARTHHVESVNNRTTNGSDEAVDFRGNKISVTNLPGVSNHAPSPNPPSRGVVTRLSLPSKPTVQVLRRPHNSPLPRLEPMDVDSPTEKAEVQSPGPSKLVTPVAPVRFMKSAAKFAIMIDPRMVLDCRIPPDLLESILELITNRNMSAKRSPLTVIYHQCMKPERLRKRYESDNNRFKRMDPVRLDAYDKIEAKYTSDDFDIIQYAEDHICDTNNRGTLRAFLICLLTWLRKSTCQKALVLAYDITAEDVTCFHNQNINLITPSEFLNLLQNDSADFLHDGFIPQIFL